MLSKRSSIFEYNPKPNFQRVAFNSSISAYFAGSDFMSWPSVWPPLSTHLNIPPAEYCVNDKRHSSWLMEVLEWVMVAEGKRMVEPGGNSTASLRSQSMRWPPFMGSKSPRAVMAHQPNARFEESRCMKERTWGPKFMVEQAKMLPGKFLDSPVISSIF